MSATLLAADIGGTKCELALFAEHGAVYRAERRKIYASRDYCCLEDVIAAYLADSGVTPTTAAFGLAGVVKDDEARITNLPWRIKADSLKARFGFSKVVLVNDLTAVCAAIPLLGAEDLVVLQAGSPQPGAPIGVIAPGTGLGEGLLLQTDTIFWPQGSEGGHCDFAPVDDEQIELLRYMRRLATPVSYEMLIAGPAIPSLYAFYRDQGTITGQAEISRDLAKAVDPTPLIVAGALADPPCPLCRRALELFLAILGSEAGNLALKTYARGGLYIGGGIVPRLYGRLSFAGFLENFRHKAKMSELMLTIPIHLIVKKDVALLGAARCGRQGIEQPKTGTAEQLG